MSAVAILGSSRSSLISRNPRSSGWGSASRAGSCLPYAPFGPELHEWPAERNLQDDCRGLLCDRAAQARQILRTLLLGRLVFRLWADDVLHLSNPRRHWRSGLEFIWPKTLDKTSRFEALWESHGKLISVVGRCRQVMQLDPTTNRGVNAPEGQTLGGRETNRGGNRA